MQDIQSDKKVFKFANYIAIIVFMCIALIIITLLVSNRNVGTIDGSLLYYNGDVYKESYDNIEIDTGRCLGKVTWKDDGTTSKVYKLKGEPEYLYVRMFLDYRLYKRP